MPRWWHGWPAFPAASVTGATRAAGCLPTPFRRPSPAKSRATSASTTWSCCGAPASFPSIPPCVDIRLDGRETARAAGLDALRAAGVSPPVVGVSPGAAYGDAKRWLPERFAETAVQVARAHGAAVALFGAAAERPLCESLAGAIAAAGIAVGNFAGQTTLAQFIDLAAACRLFLTNDSGAMHIASALGVPTVTIFGATDDTTTGPTGAAARVVREPVECSPCLLRDCPIDHRCMTRVTAERVAAVALELWEN